MQRKFVVSDPKICTGCRTCDYICSATKEKGFNPLLSRIRSIRIEPAFNMSIACRLCEDPICVKSCPRKALTKDEKTGIIQVDKDKCNGCAWCIESCEYGAITLHPDEKKVVICDLCNGDPKCVKYCPFEALMFATPEDISKKARLLLTKELAEKLIPT